MIDDAAFLAAICANPDDTAVRLVYADWLDDNAGREWCRLCGGEGRIRCWGESSRCGRCCGRRWQSDGRRERAEFIRVQCELARPEFRTLAAGATIGYLRQDAERYDVLRRRERELCPKYVWGWIPAALGAGLPGSPDATAAGWPTVRLASEALARDVTFRRGFVEAVACTLADWAARGPAVVRAQPVTEVRLSDRRPGEGYDGFYYARSAFPRELFLVLAGDDPECLAVTYASSAAALAHVSAACVAWARAAAGLPPLAGPAPLPEPTGPDLRAWVREQAGLPPLTPP